MRLFVAERAFDYEGFEIIGVFDSIEAAQHAVDNDFRPDGTKPGDDYNVEEFKLGEATEDYSCQMERERIARESDHVQQSGRFGR